ncbi:sialidase-1 [Trueperella bonasi]|uniref:exo-alpha-sialidase n=2 Tax=Trueperella bonasi TaxID=312286 RepID=A0ABT9NHS9_9ACTO|nr:LamG-like jellyroll fold domain-containing protein [Trueperella bonasi]MDP9806578.1 sialidase-1 [Trueperella bonasi]
MSFKNSWRRRLTLASAGALLITPVAPLAMASTSPDLTEAQVSYYSFDEEATTDSWGERSGTITGDVPLVEGKAGKAAHIVEGNSIAFPTADLGSDWTVGFWVKAPTAHDKSNILESSDGVRAFSQRINSEKGDKMGMYVRPDTGGFLTYGSTLPDNEWTHITWTQSSTEGLSLYVDGQLRENKTWSVQNPITIPADKLGGKGFSGLVDELKIYNRALTAAEVSASIDALELPEPPPAPKLNATFSIMNPKPEGAAFEVGETIRFELKVTNDTGIDRSFESTASNLDNWRGCKWSALRAGDTQSCPFPTHTVTDEDVKAGGFTPTITFQIYDRTGYSGPATPAAPFEGNPVGVSPRLVTINNFEFTDGTNKDNYSAGDELTASLTLTNVFDETVNVSLNDDDLKCSGAILPGSSLTCDSLTYSVTREDLERGQAELSVVVNASSGELTGTATATATTPTPTTWPTAQPFPAPNADPRLAPALSDLTKVETHVPGRYNIRIPAIAAAPNGDILASYDLRPTNGAGSGGDSPNENSIVQRRSKDGGKTWGPLTTIAKGHVAPEGQRYGWSDPSYVVDHETGEIFNFFVGSLDAGLPNNPSYKLDENGQVDESHRRTMNFTVANSTDNGYTWKLRTITNDVLGERAADVTGCFATSGAGIQKQHEPHKGRLLQQAACRHKDGGFRALTIFSDDHGKTWQSGNFASATEGAQFFRWNYDENKVAELSDGRLMLNSRIPRGSHGAGYRLVAISEDGGMNWGEYRIDEQLQDSQNNAQLLRPFPTANKGTLRSKVLLFSNTKNHWNRVNGHVSMSYDDGASWPVSKQVRTGGTGYTTMAVQQGGTIGLLMEPNIWNDIGYINFSLSYLEPELPFEVKLGAIEDVSATDGVAIEPIEVTTTGNDPSLADTYSAEGLPSGLDIDPATGTISGTPKEGLSEAASFDVRVTIEEAEDGTGIPRISSTTFTLTLAPGEKAPEPAPSPELQPSPLAGVVGSGRFGDVDGDGYADVLAVGSDGVVHFYAGHSGGIYHVGPIGSGFGGTSLTKVSDVNGDGRPDFLVRHDDGRLFVYHVSADGHIVQGAQVGHGWNGMDNITYVGRLGAGSQEYVIARQVASGDLYRYTLTSSGLTASAKIGHGWGKMTRILAVGNIVGDSNPDLVGIRSDGKMFAYQGHGDGTVSAFGQIGQGWTSFVNAFVPGDLTNDGRLDLIGIRGDGKMFFYENTGRGYFKPAVQIGHGWQTMKHIS